MRLSLLLLSVILSTCYAAKSSLDYSSSEFKYQPGHFFDGSNLSIKVRYMPELGKDWYKRHFIAAREAGYNFTGIQTDLLRVAVAECNPGMVEGLLELGVIGHPQTHVINSHYEGCEKVQVILTRYGYPANDGQEESSSKSHGAAIEVDMHDGDVEFHGDFSAFQDLSASQDYQETDEFIIDIINQPIPSIDYHPGPIEKPLHQVRASIFGLCANPQQGVTFIPF